MKRTNKQNDRKNEQKENSVDRRQKKRKKQGFSTRMNKKKHTVYTKKRKEMADLFLAYGLKEDTGNFLVA